MWSLPVYNGSDKWIYLNIFLPFSHREKLFVTSPLIHLIKKPLKIGVQSKCKSICSRSNVFLIKFNPIHKGGKNESCRVASL